MGYGQTDLAVGGITFVDTNSTKHVGGACPVALGVHIPVLNYGITHLEWLTDPLEGSLTASTVDSAQFNVSNLTY